MTERLIAFANCDVVVITDVTLMAVELQIESTALSDIATRALQNAE
jgi:hypothetical protein